MTVAEAEDIMVTKEAMAVEVFIAATMTGAAEVVIMVITATAEADITAAVMEEEKVEVIMVKMMRIEAAEASA